MHSSEKQGRQHYCISAEGNGITGYLERSGVVHMDAFPCDKCGACCANLKLFGAPYAWLMDSATGMCRYFNPESRLCAVYPIRPVICNLAIGYQLFFSHMSWQQFKDLNMTACARLKTLKPE